MSSIHKLGAAKPQTPNRDPGAPSSEITTTSGPDVYRYCLHWVVCSPSVNDRPEIGRPAGGRWHHLSPRHDKKTFRFPGRVSELRVCRVLCEKAW